MARALVIGAGAIGRGFLPWTFDNLDFDIFDTSKELCEGIEQQGGYHSFMSKNGELLERKFLPGRCTSNLSDLRLQEYDVAFVAVGPRNCSNLPLALSQLKCPVFSVENDPKSVEIISKAIGSNNVYFGIPDVIASSTASPENLQRDKFSLHTENGSLYLEEHPSISKKLRKYLSSVSWVSIDEMKREWDAKLFLHNTPHCVAAYLGYLNKVNFLHEGFENVFIKQVVEGVIEELVLALKRNTNHNHIFLEEYAEKELGRFSDSFLYDPISRVAREPLRKLSSGGRLTGALTMCLLAGVNPINLNAGITSALNYLDPKDRDYESMLQVDKFGIANFLKYYLNISPKTIESKYIVSSFEDTKLFIRKGLQWN